jgi:hypothetical protein
MSDPSSRSTEAAGSLPGRRFVGRDRELEALETGLRAASSGHGQFVALAGEAGIGKTRTVEEFVARAEIPEVRVLWGRCPDDEGAPAYWPWTQALRTHVERSDPDALRAALGSAVAEVARIVPAVRERLPDVAAAAPVPDPAESRFRLFDNIAMIKVAVPNAAQRVIDHAIQAHGAGGMTDDFGLAAAFAEARVLRIADGPDEVHRNQIGRMELSRWAPATPKPAAAAAGLALAEP